MSRLDLPISPSRILLIKPSSLGDIVHTLPVLNLLRRRWPEAKIAWLIRDTFAGLIEGHPQLDEVITFNRARFAQWWFNPRAAFELFGFLRSLGRRNFDLVIDLQGLHRSGWLARLTHAPARVGFENARELAPLFYTHHVPVKSMDQHAVDRYLSVAEALGCGREPVEFKFPIKPADRTHVESLLTGVGKYAVFLPGTNWPTKRWPTQHFAALVEPLKAQRGLTTVIAGGPDVLPIANEILASFPSGGLINVVGKTNLQQLVALLDGASLVIANDTGPMHIAAAMNKPLVTMFGPTNPVRTGPYGRADSVVRVDIPCSPCYSRRCSHVSCMKWLSPEAVLKHADMQLTHD